MHARDRAILLKIIQECEYIIETTECVNTFDEYISNEDKKRATVMTLLNIGELANHISKEFRNKHIEIPFNEIIALRNNAAHGYLTLKFELVWRTIKNDVAELKRILSDLVD